MSGALTDPGLVIHLFAPLTGPARQRAYQQLTQLWRACEGPLGMTHPIPATGLPVDPPPETALGALPNPKTLAVRRHPGDTMRQAQWLHTHDVACLSLALSGGPDTTWQDLHAQWTEASAGIEMEALIAVVEEFTALDAAASLDVDQRWCDMVAAALPGHLTNRDAAVPLPRNVATTRQGQAVWELPTTSIADIRRRLVVVGPAGGGPQLSALVWTRSEPGLAPLTRYLLHAAKLRYQVRVHQGEHRLHQLRDGSALLLHDLRRLLLRPDPATLTDGQLDRAERALVNLQAGEAGLIDATLSLTELRRTAQIASANMRAHAERLLAEAPVHAVHIFGRDRELGIWFDDQLDDDAAYLTAARDRAQQLGAAADREIQRRRRQQQEIARRRQDRFNLLQTAIIGAVLMCLTAIQSLEYRTPVPNPVKPAVVAVLGSLAFWLSTVALRRAFPLVGRDRPLMTLAGTAFGLFAATITWLVTTWATLLNTGRAAGPWVVAPLAASAGIIAVAGWWTRRRADA